MATMRIRKISSNHNQKGFTLIEILIVVVLLGILATIIIPQISISTDDAKLNTLHNNLTQIRAAIELYYYQHNNNYPGKAVPGTKPDDVTDVAEAFVAQLTRYTDVDGNISNSKDATYKYGPYIKGGSLPENPYNNLSDVTVDTTETDITKKDSTGAGTGYKFYAITGVFMAADGSHDTL
ncbi:MAG: type II secretion system protein [Deltaproteobacteria bacterium]|nr:type II secretion system protein [Deltaproteobacteria bacterium]